MYSKHIFGPFDAFVVVKISLVPLMSGCTCFTADGVLGTLSCYAGPPFASDHSRIRYVTPCQLTMKSVCSIMVFEIIKCCWTTA
jgi:hypothetical protein